MGLPYRVEEVHNHDNSKSAYVTVVGEYPTKTKAKQAFDGISLHNARMKWGRRFRLIELIKDTK